MYEINVAALETDSRDFPLARRAVLGRYNIASSTRRPERTITSKRSAFVSTRSATSGRARTAGDATAAIGRAMRDFFMAAPCWRACARGSSPLVYHEP